MQALTLVLAPMLVLPILIGGGLQAQNGKRSGGPSKAGKPQKAAPKDPYTKEDQEAMQRAGYVRFGPLPWGDNHSTQSIEQLLAGTTLLWVETAHFKIGSALPAYLVPKEKEPRQALITELKQLQQKFPGVKPTTRILDPWLRLHLMANRLEATYAELQKDLDVTDASFPTKALPNHAPQKTRPPAAPSAASGAPAAPPVTKGRGPYLGQPGKYLVLLLGKRSDLMRYSKFATGADHPADLAHVHNFRGVGSMFFGTHTELSKGLLANDHEMHCQIVFSMSGVLLDGYQFFGHPIPAWLREGVAHSFVRRVDEKARFFVGIRDWDKNRRDTTNWPLTMRQLAQNKDFRKAADLLQHASPKDFELMDHIAIWSRIEFLRREPKRFAEFLDLMKAPIPVPPGKMPEWSAILARQTTALQKAYGLSLDDFDKAWIAFVLKTYPRR